MTNPLPILTAFARQLQGRLSLDQVLQGTADTAATLLDTRRVSIRLLDPSRKNLIATCRVGHPLHEQPQTFRRGQGLIGWIAEHGEAIRVNDAESDPRFEEREGRTQRLGSFLGVPLMAGANCAGVLSAIHPEEGYFTEAHTELLVLLAAVAAPHVEMARLSRLSTVDPLTGTLNRRGLAPAFPEVAFTGEDGEQVPLAVAMADIDHFKGVNDTYGHAIGDEALKAVSHILAEVVRKDDAVIRYGGEEFLMILTDIESTGAKEIAERARAAIEDHVIRAGDTELSVTISIGVAERVRGEGRDAVIGRADEALYRAKEGGRNRVELAAKPSF